MAAYNRVYDYVTCRLTADQLRPPTLILSMGYLHLYPLTLSLGKDLHISYLLLSPPSECSEYWRRLRDWPFCPSIVHSVYMITNNSNDVTAPIAQTATLAITFPPSAVKRLFLFPPLSL